MRKTILSVLTVGILIAGIIRCSKHTSAESPGDSDAVPYSIKRNALADLPTCNASYEGALAYVTNLSKFYVCASGAWTELSITGADGSLRVYGDGSAGALTVSSSDTLSNLLTNGNAQFTNVTINAGVTLTVSSGTVIRCTGTFTNNGTVSVSAWARSGASQITSSTITPALAPAHPGSSAQAAGFPEFGDNSQNRMYGEGGTGMDAGTARFLLMPGPAGGGGSTPSIVAGSSQTAAQGGGTFVVIAQGALATTGTISATDAGAASCRGGGSGGIIILASKTTVTNSGTINAAGAAGGASSTSCGSAGGGGGGIVHLLAPTAPTVGTVNVTGGSGGSGATNVTANPRAGGGGGGACGGNGGSGGLVYTDNTVGTASVGSAGHSLTTVADPVSLF